MKKTRLLYAFVSDLALCASSAASASSPGAADPGLLSLVPPGAPIVAQVTYGREPTYLVLTRNNTADLMDLQAISGVDPTRTIARTVFVAARGSQGLVSEHSLLASGRFDPRHIFKAAMENGAIRTDGLIMGIHFGRRVEIEFEIVPDSAGSDGSPPQAQPVSSPSPNQIAQHLASFLSNGETPLLKVVKFSKRQYGEFIAREQARELTYVEQMSSQPTRK